MRNGPCKSAGPSSAGATLLRKSDVSCILHASLHHRILSPKSSILDTGLGSHTWVSAPTTSVWWILDRPSRQPADSQPASQPPTILNIGPSPAPKGWSTIWVPFCGLRWVLWPLFYGALHLNCNTWGFRAGSSHKLKQSNTPFHTFAQSFCAKTVELPI